MLWRRAMDDDEAMIEEYLDAAGTVRTFRLRVYRDGQFLEAVERHDGAWAGLRFVLPAKDGEPPWGEMREGIRAWLARRDVARDPRSGRLELLTRALRGQIDSIGDDGGPWCSSTTSSSDGTSWAACSRATKGGTSGSRSAIRARPSTDRCSCVRRWDARVARVPSAARPV